ncbi:uncharacterized protein [Bemisia tabaci]|uniref:uncharacterized protein n=1 Tax=Bemisia tabaci TaxID=7038 RepID=UPI0008F9BE6D|nr:PREDICTED: oral cancer-overexpressed protein 1 [Bemisia tabaci]
MAAGLETSETVDINDVFDSIALSESKLVKQGYSEGYRKGTNDGELSGFHLGYHRGKECGTEIGYYKGVVNTWLTLHDQKICTLSDKILLALSKVKSLIDEFPMKIDDNIDIVELKNNISASYKKACSLLKFDVNCSADFSF